MKVLLFANTDWYLYNFRLALAKAIRAEGHEVILLSPPGKYGERLRQAGFRWIEFPLARRRLNPFAELMTIIRLALLYRKECPEIVHHFTVKCVLYGSIAARFAHIKAVVNALAGLGHIFTAEGLQTKLLRYLVRCVCKATLRSTQVIFQNPDDHFVFLKHGLVTGEASHLIRGSGVDVKRFNLQENKVRKDKQHVLFASRLLWSKGIAEYVEAARLIRRSHPDVSFLIAGDADPGNPASVPQEVIDEWKQEKNLEILGHCDDIHTLLEQADLVVLPSYREGLPRILLEAAASGKALVATDVPGCREIVENGFNGLLVPARNPEQLVRAIQELLLDDKLRVEMGRRSRELACTEFSEEHVITKTFQVYQQCLPSSQVISRNDLFIEQGAHLFTSPPAS